MEILARQVAPGELLRIVVALSAPATSVEGRLLGAPVSFVEAGSRWSGWAVVPLDRKPGPTKLELTVRETSGRTVAASIAVRVAKRTFPEQRLEVEEKYVSPSAEDQKRIEREQKRLGEIYARRTPRPPAGRPFVRPVPGEPTSVFGMRRFFNGEPRAPHAGLDLKAPSGTTVASAGPGVVAFAGDLFFAGRTVIVDHGGGLFTIYGHLSEIGVREGDSIDAGKAVGLSGATGRVTGPHLHWGARVGDRIFDPRALLDARLFR